MKQGDRIVNIDGRAVHNPIELRKRAEQHDIRPSGFHCCIAREPGSSFAADSQSKLTQARTPKEYLGWWVEVAVSLIQLLVGLLVLFKRPRDLTAVAAGIFLCSLGTGTFYFLSPNAAVVWRNLPLPSSGSSSPW